MGAGSVYASAPTLSSSNPLDGATGIAVDTNIVFTFSEAVDNNYGQIIINKSSDNSVFEAVGIYDSIVTGRGTSVITLNPRGTLDELTSYYITMSTTAYRDLTNIPYAGITDSTTLNFTTIGTAAASIVTPTCAGTGPNCKDLTYWEAIEYFGLTPVFTLFPGPNSPVSEPTVFIGIDSFVSFDKG